MKSKQRQEELIRQCLTENNKRDAIKRLFELITACAKERDFETAEALRDQIFKIDPMALNEIIRSAEIIEEGKNEAIDKDHRETWAELYSALSVEEANALYFALEHAEYGPAETVFEQGEYEPRLYFINSGRPKLVHSLNGTEVFLKILTPGQIAGEETFFSDTIYTASMITHERVKLSYLDADIIRHWKKDFSVLESKLQDFASRSEKICDILKARKLDRRVHKRINVLGSGAAHLMSSSGNPVGNPLRVDMCDISRGGVCFFLRISRRETANQLLGRRLRIGYLHPQLDSDKAINKICTIVAVRFHHFSDCSVHAKFDDWLGEKTIEDFNHPPPPVQCTG